MVVNNHINKVTKRSRGFANFDRNRIVEAILKAARSVGSFKKNLLDEPFHEIYHGKSDQEIAELLTDDVVICLNADELNRIPYRPPRIELIQDLVEHVLYSRGFIEVAECYYAYRSGRKLIRDKEITEEQFAGIGIPKPFLDELFEWNVAHNCETMDKVNQIVREGSLKSLIDDSMAEYESNLDRAAEMFLAKPDVRVLVVCGPSSSGKTTTTHKLCERLKKKGVRFKSLELDNYFWDLQQHPRDAFGDYNYEVPESLDLILINEHIRALLNNETIHPPIYDFATGHRQTSENPFHLESDEVLLLDSLYGLFPSMTTSVARNKKFQLYIETLSPILEGDGSTGKYIRFTDYRLLRRMLRDVKYRNHPIDRTLAHWHYVRKGELRDIIPRINVADIVINGGLAFELPVLKQLIDDVFPEFDSYYGEGRLDAYIRGKRVRDLLDNVEVADIDPDDYNLIPEDCHIREFIGGSKYSSHN